MHRLRLARGFRAVSILLALSGGTGASLAEASPDHYWAQLEYFFPTISSTVRVDFPGTHLPGTVISLEEDLGLADRKGTPYVLLGMRLGERWRLEFEYYRLNRSATETIGREIQFGDLTFPVSAEVGSTFDTSIYRIVGGYSFVKTPEVEVGASLGLHATDFGLALSGRSNGPAGLAFQTEQRDQLIPLPTLGLYGTWMLSERFVVRGRADYLSLKYDDYDGKLINLLAAIDWRFSKNISAGLGYRYVDYDLESSRTRLHGELNYRFRGPTAFVQAMF